MQTVKVPETPKYPERPITVIVPFGVGSGIDLVARTLEKAAPKYLGQPLVIINKPGGTGTIGWNELVGANPDGYTLGISSVEIGLHPLYGSSKYNYPTALSPIAQVTTAPWVMAVQANKSWKDVATIIEYGKANPGKLKFGHQGIGSLSHIVGETFSQLTESTLEQVPFRGGGETVAALLGGHIDIAFVSPSMVKEHLKNGTIQVLAISAEQRLNDPVFMQVPTFKELGWDIVFSNWFGVAAPKELTPNVKDKLNEGFKALIADAEFKQNIENLGFQIEYLDAKDSEKQWINDSQNFTKKVQKTGIIEKIKLQRQ